MGRIVGGVGLKVLVVVSESAKKSGKRGRVEDVFEGPIFRTVKKVCREKGYDYVVLSLRHGVLFPDDVIDSYGEIKVTRDNRDKLVEQLRRSVEARLKDLIEKYDKVYVVAGEIYREALKGLGDGKIIYLEARGYGDMLRKIKTILLE